VLAIATYATKSYFHVWPQFLRRIAAAAGHHAEAHFILATDQSDEAKAAVEAAKVELPEGWRIQAIALPLDDGGVEGKDYKQPAQMRIAAFKARPLPLPERSAPRPCGQWRPTTLSRLTPCG
jgi:hypothetical protein